MPTAKSSAPPGMGSSLSRGAPREHSEDPSRAALRDALSWGVQPQGAAHSGCAGIYLTCCTRCAHFIFSPRKIFLHHPSSKAEAKLSPNTAHKINSNTKIQKIPGCWCSPQNKRESSSIVFSLPRGLPGNLCPKMQGWAAQKLYSSLLACLTP